MNTLAPARKALVLPGITLISTSVLAAAVMMFHPEAQGADIETCLSSLAAISSVNMHVHLAMIFIVISIWLSLAYAARVWPTSE